MGSSEFAGRRALGLAGLALLLATVDVTGGAMAAEGQVAQVAAYDIPAQPLGLALTAFGRQSGLQIVADDALLSGLQSHAVSGDMTPEQALGAMLSGTGLTWRSVDEKTWALEALPMEPSGALAPLTVTAERTERSIMDTATSVVIFDEETIEQRPGLNSTNDLLSEIPNIASTGTTNLAPSVRGLDGTGAAQGANAFLAGTRPRLNVQVDGRPLSYNEVVFGDMSLWDVSSAEMLRGAQSTLQGRNAIAGTMALRTNDPTYDFEFGGRTMFGNQDTRVFSAMASGPIIDDQLAFRLAFDHQLSESYIEFEDLPEQHDDPNHFRTTNVRGKLLIEPEAWEGFKTVLTVQHSAHQAPQTEMVLRPVEDHEASYPFQPIFNPKSTAGIVESSWEVNDNWTLEGTFSATGIDIERKAMPDDGSANIDGMEIVAEPRVKFTGLDGDLKLLAGTYYFNSRQDERIDLLGGGAFDDKTDTHAVFAEGVYTFLEDFDLTVGARYEHERRRRTGAMNIFEIDLDKSYDAFMPKVGLAWRPSDEWTVGAVVSRGYNGGGAGFTFEPPFQSYTFKPEYVWTYEGYARAELLDGSLVLTGNAFYSRYKDMQLPTDLNPGPNIYSVIIRNADRVDTYGVELGARWQATPELQLFADLGVLETDIKKFPGSDLEGNDLAVAPDVTADFGFIYRHPIGFDFSADARYTGSYDSTVDNLSGGEIDPFWVLNAQMGYSIGDDDANLRLFAYVNNLLDSDDAMLIEVGATSSEDAISIVPPRTFGIGLQAKF